MAHGEQLYRESCVACHGVDAKGVANLGNPLVGYALHGQQQRPGAAGHDPQRARPERPANTTGLVMPPNGGRPDLNDEDIMAIIAFLRAQQ